MKDWKAECAKVRGENATLREEVRYLRNQIREREDRADAIRDKFKELLIDVLGRT